VNFNLFIFRACCRNDWITKIIQFIASSILNFKVLLLEASMAAFNSLWHHLLALLATNETMVTMFYDVIARNFLFRRMDLSFIMSLEFFFFSHHDLVASHFKCRLDLLFELCI